MKARKAYLLWKHTGWYNQLSPSMQRLLIWGDAWTMYLFEHTFIYRAAHPLLLPVYPHHQSTQQMKDGGRRMQLVHWHNTYLSFSKAESYDREIPGPSEGYCSTTHLMRVTETVCIHTAISGVHEKSEVFSYRLKISPCIDYFHSHSFPRSCWFVTLKIYKDNNNKKNLKTDTAGSWLCFTSNSTFDPSMRSITLSVIRSTQHSSSRSCWDQRANVQCLREALTCAVRLPLDSSI